MRTSIYNKSNQLSFPDTMKSRVIFGCHVLSRDRSLRPPVITLNDDGPFVRPRPRSLQPLFSFYFPYDVSFYDCLHQPTEGRAARIKMRFVECEYNTIVFFASFISALCLEFLFLSKPRSVIVLCFGQTHKILNIQIDLYLLI